MTNPPNPSQAARPTWLPASLYPFESRWQSIGGTQLHYIDEGSGPTLLLLHGNPTWSFLYRDIIHGLRDRFRCIAVDYPGFGLSRAAPDYGFAPSEHSRVLGELVRRLDLSDVTMMVQDWGGPIGFGVATREPERFSRFVIGNTWAWPKSDTGTQVFSRFLGGSIGNYLIHRHNFFVERVLPSGVRRHPLTPDVMAAYRGPFPTPESRHPTYVFPREILASRWFLGEVQRGLPRSAKPSGADRLGNQGPRVPQTRARALGVGVPQSSDGDARGGQPLHPGGRA